MVSTTTSPAARVFVSRVGAVTFAYARHTRKRLNEFADRYPETKTALAQWYSLAKQNNFSNFAELRATFSSADQVGGLTVFNIGGNKVRLIAAIHYNRRKIYIRTVLTHSEYDEGKWME